jgi:ABC-type transporter Mla subunit MlaD
MNTSNTIDEKYQEAIQSLKKINDELFYDDLKKLLKEREETIAGLNGEVYESIENMQRSMNSFPVQVGEQLKEEVFTPQAQLFDQGMERFNENILVLEKKVAFWHQQFQEYLEKTEKLLADAKGFQQEDQEFIAKESERVLAVVRQLTEDLSEQSAVLNVKYEVVSDRLAVILKELSAVRDRQKVELQELREQVVQVQRDGQDKWEEKWRLSVERGARREGQLKKWLLGLAVGQGVSVLLMVLYFIMK